MKLSNSGLRDRAAWTEKGYTLPDFDRAAMVKATKEDPIWIHFGSGNIFRAFPAVCQQTLLNEGLSERGIVVCEGYDDEIIPGVYDPFDNLSILAVLKPDGTMDKKIVASVAEAINISRESWPHLCALFSNPALQMASFTITEKGYAVKNAAGEYSPAVAADIELGPQHMPRTTVGQLAALLYCRFLQSKHPMAMVSMDNCSQNGAKLYAGIAAYAEGWIKKGLAEKGFADYISDPSYISFPWSMIDKITPRPDDKVRAALEADGLEKAETVITSKFTYIAPFVNAEEPQYLVIEDLFPNGRPPLEKAGVIFTDRDTVNKVEKMKVCTCLNPLHTALAVFGCLLSFNTIYEEIRDPQLSAMVNAIGYDEGMPVVVDPKIISPADFLREVIEVRLPNPFMPDTPQRIATDTSQKLPIRFGETIKAYMVRPDLDVQSLRIIPLVLAGWLRYMLGVNDEGEPFDISPDPLQNEVQSHLSGIKLGDRGPFMSKLEALLKNSTIFGIDLFEAGLAKRVESLFAELVSGPGAVRETLKKHLE